MSLTLPDRFDEFGFLCEGSASGIADLRRENAEWFKLTEDVNSALMQTADSAMRIAKVNSWAPKAVAVRILLRSCGTLQGIVLLTERGMVAEGRMLVRSLIENVICTAAIHEQPQKFVQMLRDDSDASRQRQRRFIAARRMIDEGVARDRLLAAIEEFRKLRSMNLKEIAELGPLGHHYLAYQRLSDDSGHLTAASLHRHVLLDAAAQGWRYQWCIGDQGENSATLYHAVLAAIGIGVGVTQLFGDKDNNAKYGNLSRRFQEMPPVPVV